MSKGALFVVILAVGGVGFGWYSHMQRKHGLGPMIWRWFSGMPLDRQYRTNATWTKRSRGDKPVLHPTGHASWFWHQARLARAAIRTGGTFGAGFAAWAWLYHREAAIQVAIAGAAAFVAFLGWQVYRHAPHPVHHFRWVRPAKRKVTAELAVAPTVFRVPQDRSEVTIGLPGDRILDEPERKALTYVVEKALAIEAPDPDWRQWGRQHKVIFRRSDPPPELVTWADIEHAVAAAGPHELVTGIGKRGKTVTVSLTADSPHFGISMGSGAGKSNLATFWLVQELRRGAIVMILDAKWMSHPWVFKDMDAEYGQLPSARYARRTEDLHDAMVWLGDEVKRRSQVADRIINAKGDLLGDVGPRLWVIAEEMNMAAPRLKEYWADIRDRDQPKRSPAFSGFGAVSYAGRALKMHMIVIGQQLTVAAVGGGDVRENLGVRCLSRYTANSWKMLAGDLPMPPSVMAPGRVQCVVGPDVSETQVPLMDLEQARELVLAGDITPCPAGMPGIATDVLRPSVLAGNIPAMVASDQGIDLGNLGLPPGPSRPPGTVTIREAVEGGLLPMKLETAQRRSTRPGFPPSAGKDGRAHLYRISDLAKVKQ